MYIAPGQGGRGAYSPQGTKFWCQQKCLVTSVICCQFQIIDDKSFWKVHCFTFFPYKSIRDQIWPCRKIGQGQPRVIIWANLVVLKQPDAAYKVSRSSAFWFRRRFFKVFTIYGHGGHLGHVTRTVWTNFCFPRWAKNAVYAKTAGLSDKTGIFLFCLAENFSPSHKCPATLCKSQILIKDMFCDFYI